MRPSLLLAIALAACAAPSDQPLDIALHDTACDYCHMAIASTVHAAELVPARGTPRFFDEPGCLAHYVAALASFGTADRVWVHDAATGAWVDARAAWFVVQDRPAEGMMYGITAWADRAAAESAAGNGRVTDFATLLEEVRL